MPYLEDQLEDSFLRAYNMGREAGARNQGVDYGVWSAILDGQACDFCSWADGRTFPVVDSHLVPPAHFGCRCLVAYYDVETVEEDGLEIEELFLPWTDPPNYVYPFGSKKGTK